MPAVLPSFAVRLRCRADGHVLLESLLCIAIVGIGAIPLALVGSTWLRWSGQHERLTATLQLAAEQSEAGTDTWPLVSGDPARVALCKAASAGAGCLPGTRLAVATLPVETPTQSAGNTAPPSRIALWVSP